MILYVLMLVSDDGTKEIDHIFKHRSEAVKHQEWAQRAINYFNWEIEEHHLVEQRWDG